MKNIFKTYRNEWSYEIMPLGFHGDEYLIDLIDNLVTNCGVNTFIETGTNVGSTLKFFANKYKEISCFSCEPEKKAFDIAVNETKALKNVKLMNLSSEDFLQTEECKSISQDSNAVVLFWLDAHGYGFKWPVQEEFDFIFDSNSSNIVLIDDYLVPDRMEFGYDKYDQQICSHDYIFSKRTNKNFDLYYPSYNRETSSFHPLRGWGLYFINSNIPPSIKNISYLESSK